MKLLHKLIVVAGVLAAVFGGAPASAQDGCPSIIQGAVLTAAQWNKCFQNKQNTLGFPALNKNGDVMLGRLILAPSDSTGAGLRIPYGVAPTLCTNGDTWTTSLGMFVCISNTAIGPLASNASVVTSFNSRIGAVVPTTGDYTPAQIGLGNVTNDTQTKAAVVPNTAPAAGQILVGNAGGTAYAPVTASGSCTISSAGVFNCPGVTSFNSRTGAVAPQSGDYTASMVGLGNVTNDAQTKAAIVPNTAPSAGQILVGNAGGTAYAPVTLSGSCTLSSTGVLSCPPSVTSFNSRTGDVVPASGDYSAAQIAPSGIYNVKYYGATGNGVTDDTTNVQTAVTAACAVGGTVYFPPGVYIVTNINASGCTNGVALIGAGVSNTNATRIVSNGASSIGKNFIDFTGTYGPVVRDLRIIAGTDATNTTQTAILIAPKFGGNAIDIITLDNVWIGGYNTSGTVYCYGCTSSGWKKLVAWNYLDATNSLSLVLTRVNAQGISSAYQTIATGDQGGSDIACFACEFHHHKQAGGTTTNVTIYLGGFVRFMMYGGNVAGSSGRLVTFQVENSVSPSETVFDTVTFYSENGTDPSAVFGFDTGASVDYRMSNKPSGTAWSVGAGAPFWKLTPYFSAYLSSSQSLLAATWTKIAIDTKSFDNGGYFNTSNNRYTPLIPGKYRVTVSANLFTTAGGSAVNTQVAIYKNGSAAKKGGGIVGAGLVNYQNETAVTAIIDMNGSTDYVEAYANIGGSSVSVGPGATDTWFESEYLGP